MNQRSWQMSSEALDFKVSVESVEEEDHYTGHGQAHIVNWQPNQLFACCYIWYKLL